ncbi:MAG TPA: protein TolR [Alphaproteobacteria bacterium]|nr:protein TolR [Alphaproteobacteria bacterium]
MSEINVTPMVDVMLVLLVIFMVTAPLLSVGVPVDLPKTSAAPITGQDEPLVVTVNAKGDVYLQNSEVPLDQLAARLKAITVNKPDQRIFVKGDKALNYGRIMEVMGVIDQGGFKHLALVGDLATPSPAPAKKGAK